MKNLLIVYLVDNFDIYFSDYLLNYGETKETIVYYAFKSFSKELIDNDIIYNVKVEYYNNDNYIVKCECIEKAITISTEQILVYLFEKINNE